MFFITQKDKKEILEILLKHDGKCKMSDLVKEYSYSNDKYTKKKKIKEVLEVLNKELKKSVVINIVENKGIVEILF